MGILREVGFVKVKLKSVKPVQIKKNLLYIE